MLVDVWERKREDDLQVSLLLFERSLYLVETTILGGGFASLIC